MADEILNYIILLENTVATFYQRLKNIPEYKKINPILEFMETHSSEHADFINQIKNNYERPSMNGKIIVEYQNNISRKVLKKIINESNHTEILKILADSEESIGILYDKITDFLLQSSEYFKNLSDAVKKIAKEEYDHRDILLRDRENLLKK
jgi:hypothetical protein